MQITEVRIKLMDDPNDRLQAFCSVTFDFSFVVRDLKIIQGTKGPFVAMPSRKLTDRCPKCGSKNELRSRHCCDCGAKLDDDRAARDDSGRARLYADIAHPINSECRDMIQASVLEAYEQELVKSREPGYVCRYDDYGEDRFATLADDEPSTTSVDPGPADTPAATNSENSTTPVTDDIPSDVSHRIEPAAQKSNAPHRPDIIQPGRRDHQRTSVSAAETSSEIETDDNFGVGVE